MACVIICLAPSTSSLFPPAFKYLKAPIRKYTITKTAAIEKTGVTNLLVASPKDATAPKPKCSPMFTGPGDGIKMVTLL